MTDDGRAVAAAFWEEAAAGWVRFEGEHERATSLFNAPLFAAAGLRPGHSVVDIGCGTGPTTILSAQAVGPDGKVVGVDVARAMLDRAEEVAASQGLTNITFRQADAQNESLGDQRFDAAISRFGLMFFADPHAAFANVLIALKPGGRLVFVCWTSAADNEWMLLRGMALFSVTGEFPELPAEGEPGPFSLSDDGRVRAVLEGSGFVNVRARTHRTAMELPIDAVDRYVDSATALPPLSQVFEAGNDETTRRRVLDAYRASLAERERDGVVELGVSAWVVTAERPGPGP
ncbi:MAG: class I SAM-dependent methyltransferase [Acidimicrobiales bacterium]